ncbi:MAG: terminase [Chlorobi bacterium]|nr:terminase [Chlorobiota bacterium]
MLPNARVEGFDFSRRHKQRNQKPLWEPHPNNIPQQQALASAADEVFYGGSAGGGKTDLGLGAAVTAHHRSLILRREYPQARSIIERLREIVEDAGKLNENTGIYRLDTGQQIEIGSCVHEKDKNKYKGRPHDLKVFDEVTEFTRTQYEFIVRWNRSARAGQRCRVISTFNPPTTTEGSWVLEYLAPWIDKEHPHPANPGELRWFAVVNGETVEVPSGSPFEVDTPRGRETVHPRSRTFIPARLTDNPYLMADATYLANLQATPEPLRSQLLYGDMQIAVRDDEWQVVPSEWLQLSHLRWEAARKASGGKPGPLSAMGIDVARGGEDNTVIAKAYGRWIDDLLAVPGSQTKRGSDVADLVLREYETSDDLGLVPIVIDQIGVGGSAYDALEDGEHRVYGANAAAATGARSKQGNFGFYNVRAEMYWRLREALDPYSDDPIALPPDKLLDQEIKAHRFEKTVRGIKIVSKDEVKAAIGGRSPDRAEALALLVRAMQKV